MKGETKTRAGFTPGPWKFVDEEYAYDAIRGADGSPVVTVHAPYGSEAWVQFGDREHFTGNARLIRAAPDLLEALESLVDAVAPTGDGDVEPYCQDPLKRARKAITKATEGD